MNDPFNSLSYRSVKQFLEEIAQQIQFPISLIQRTTTYNLSYADCHHYHTACIIPCLHILLEIQNILYRCFKNVLYRVYYMTHINASVKPMLRVLVSVPNPPKRSTSRFLSVIKWDKLRLIVTGISA